MNTTGKVLVVDDDHAIRETLCAVLRDEGYDVAGARDGEEALRALRDPDPPRAVVLDLMMPGMDGYEFRARQLADATIKDIPVLVITAAGAPAVREQELRAPVVTKPFDLELLERKLQALGL
jgi:CheY-like chemotaxis protein